MNKPRPPEEQPWEPDLDTLPLFNPFRNPVEHLEAPRTTPIGEDVDEEIAFDPDENP